MNSPKTRFSGESAKSLLQTVKMKKMRFFLNHDPRFLPSQPKRDLK